MVKDNKVIFLRYEDICSDPAKKMKEVFNFLGGPYADMDSSKIDGYFSGNYTDWRECIYTEADLNNQAKAFDLVSGDDIDDHSIHSMFDDTWFSTYYEKFALP